MQPTAQSPLYIFLDFDGVIRNLNEGNREDKLKELFPGVYPYTLTHHLEILNQTFDGKAVKNLDRIIEEISKVREVFIIVASAWRQGSTKDELITAIKQHQFSHYIVDKTPDKIMKTTKCTLKDTFCRAGQIKEWLEDHPEVLTYVIIDDHDFHLRENFGRKFFQVNDKTLLTVKDADTLIEQFSQV